MQKEKGLFEAKSHFRVFLKWYRRKHICEYLCDDCSKPYNEKPKGLGVEQFVSGSSSAIVYVEENYGRKNHYVEFGRIKVFGDKMTLSPLFSIDHLVDVAKVAEQAHHFIKADRRNTRRLH